MESDKYIDLGSWLGLQKAFATISGSCTAARAQCLKQVRDSKMLDDLGFTWEEFCKEYAGMSRVHADNLIRQHDQFGDAYFRLTEIARVSPKTYQQIAGQLDGDSIEIDGEKLALIPANAHKIRAGIEKLRNQLRRAPVATRPPARVGELQLRIDAVAEDAGKAISALNPLESREEFRGLVAYAIRKFQTLAARLEQ